MIDEVITVRDKDAIKMARLLIMEEGLFVGISSGANVYASIKVAKELGKENTVVTVLSDNVYRYFSAASSKTFSVEELKLWHSLLVLSIY